jgi:hypothetical protein
MKISLCIACMGRAHHVKETLPKNLEDNADWPDTEFVMVDYNSKDDLEVWMMDFLRTSPMAKKVAYYRERTVRYYEGSHSKNLAHLLATGDVVMNLDADNFTGVGYAEGLSKLFEPGRRIVAVNGSKNPNMGGRVGLRKDDFLRLRGYDEKLHGQGWHDVDLHHRAIASGCEEVPMKWPCQIPIQHSNEERMRLCENPSWGAAAPLNRKRIAARPPGYIVNAGGFGKATVLDREGGQIQVGVL